MGPLVPDIISANFNFVVALLVGFAFGWILEQAGFSTSKKLVGLFYGYDFTVLRVFFTAGITAMIGVLALVHFGLLDINLTYINPTFLWSAVVGGLIMGLGFVVGGFCPGTSVCAAAIGKIDAMLFVLGGAVGVLLFAEGYPLFEGLYKAANWGSPQMFTTLGISQSLFAFLLTVVALVAFWAVGRVEARVNGTPPVNIFRNRISLAVGLAGVLVAVSGFVLPGQRDALLANVSNPAFVASHPVQKMDVDEFALRVMEGDQRLQVIDFRPQSDAAEGRLPRSVTFTTANLFEKEPSAQLNIRHRTYVFIARDEEEEHHMAILAGELGHSHIVVLDGGYKRLQDAILRFPEGGMDDAKPGSDSYRFRTHARSVIPALIAANKQSGPVEKKIKRAVGGC